jgi:hypothetical protein
VRAYRGRPPVRAASHARESDKGAFFILETEIVFASWFQKNVMPPWSREREIVGCEDIGIDMCAREAPPIKPKPTPSLPSYEKNYNSNRCP